ncbi:MAG TPA: hypothetical protein VM098_08095 [Phycisphaerae bacterium]|nr:hypothetical protein [Phycisphaerae bacterium]
MVAPLHKGDRRRANSLPVFVKGGQVRVQFPMSVVQTSWLKEPRSDVSPFSCHEHDPALPATYGRRVWALVLTPRAIASAALQGGAGTGNAVRIYYGVVGLDRYKNYILEWEDTGVEYPRVFTTPEWQAKPAQGDLPDIRTGGGRDLQASINLIVSSISIHHHHTLGDFGGPVGAAEAALANPNLPADDRAALRRRLALLCYLLTEPDVTSAGNGSHHGNPNMGIARLSDRSNLAALIPDHPMHKTWAEYMGDFMAYKQGTFMAPEGSWIEYGVSYHQHGYGKIHRGLMVTGADAITIPAIEFTWDRQVVFLKSPNAKGANYFVIRDSVNGPGKAASWFNLNIPGRKEHLKVTGEKVAVDTEWPTKLEMIFTDREKPAFEMVEDDLPLAVGSYSKPTGTSRDWVDGKEQHVALRLQNAPGQEVAWVLFPRGAGETEPTATQLAPGVTRVVTQDGTDYVFLSATPLEYKGEGLEFAGQAGAVRVPKAGEPELVLLRGSKLSFKGKTVSGPAAAEPQVTAEGGKIRFVAPAPVYVNLKHGNAGVRGMGPFDLTFTPEGITGTVDGGVRTIVTTWPEKITRPGYWMDGVRWSAGFADEHSIYKGAAAPQFAVAFGVSAGKHEVKLAEWEWPAMPPTPARAALTLK